MTDHDRGATTVARRRLMSRIPAWMRVPGIIVLVLAGILASTMLLGSLDISGGHGTGEEADMGGGHGTGEEADMGGGHGTGDGIGEGGHE